ncbi:MAG: MBL fold metallo-hydrolase [Myxococcota bacterium]|nr:MBL fold metallo-hydrolase [Myxococcota bacterium]
MKKLLLSILALLLVLGIGAYLFQGPITLGLMDRLVATRMSTSLLDQLPDGLNVVLCGAGSPLPDPERSGPCTAIVAGEHLFLIDSGSNSSRILTQLQLPHGEIDGILITHFHSDHIDGLGEMLLQAWIGSARTQPMPVYGPVGVEEIVEGLNRVYSQDRIYRTAHHGEDIAPSSGAGAVPRPFSQPAPGEARVIFDDDELRITAFSVLHEPVEPAVGYRFDYKGRSVVVSGDTRKSKNLENFAQGTDLLIHEALSRELVGVMTMGAEKAGQTNLAKITKDILDYHASPVEAAESASAAGADHLLFYHIVPPLLISPMEALFVEGVSDAYDGPFTVGRDGTLISLPAGSDEITVEQLL